MATQTKLQVIDADAHVIETERTWDYLEPAEQKFRPVLLPNPYDAERQMWSIHGASAGFRFADLSEEQLEELSLKANRDMSTPKAARELDDVALRLHHMDQLGIDVQILHNTMWIEQVTQNPDVEAALCRSWNKWLADVHRQSNGRLRWSCVIPTLSLDEAVNQMRFAKENGSVAVCMRPLEGDRSLTDPYFYPVYEEATNLTWPWPCISPTPTPPTSTCCVASPKALTLWPSPCSGSPPSSLPTPCSWARRPSCSPSCAGG